MQAPVSASACHLDRPDRGNVPNPDRLPHLHAVHKAHCRWCLTGECGSCCRPPVPTIDQVVTAFPTPADCVTCAPFRNHIATLPLVSRQRMSPVPSPLKSPVGRCWPRPRAHRSPLHANAPLAASAGRRGLWHTRGACWFLGAYRVQRGKGHGIRGIANDSPSRTGSGGVFLFYNFARE